MLRSYELLRDNDPLREHYRHRFQHILVDEFQDTNKLQYAWLKQLAGPVDQGGGAILAVGDDDQSIYAFRGARVGNMADFVREYNVTHQIKLEQNYRSFSNILDSANHLISHNKGRLGKNLHTTQGAGEPVRVYESPTDFAEAQWMVEEMKQLLRDGQNGDGANGVQHRSEIAVLYRSNAQSRVIETALFNAAMPYRVYGGLRFFERAEIKHALAYLRLLENPRDDTSFMRVVNFPPRGIGARSIEQLQDASRAMGCAMSDAVTAVAGKAGANLSAFVAKIDVLREQTQGQNLRQIIELLLDHSGLITHYQTEREGQDRIENLQELVNAAESFVTQEGFGRDAVALPIDEHGQPVATDGNAPTTPQTMINADTGETLSPLAAFLTHAALESGDNQAQAGQDAIQLMTVHASKGLEFDCVFITGMEEGLFPHENSMNDFDGLEEERRLMYVAITRARKRLYLSHSQTRMLHGQTRYNLKSRFFEELPEHTMKWITPARSAFADAMPSRRDAWQNNNGWQNNAWGGGAATAAAPKPVPQRAAPVTSGPNAWVRSGVQVFHAKFGEGAVISIEGVGDDARAQVNFPRHGTKWLALSVAKLTQV
jgi:DNA helicase-2/ATP-dependent DNA helicase PcrA